MPFTKSLPLRSKSLAIRRRSDDLLSASESGRSQEPSSAPPKRMVRGGSFGTAIDFPRPILNKSGAIPVTGLPSPPSHVRHGSMTPSCNALLLRRGQSCTLGAKCSSIAEEPASPKKSPTSRPRIIRGGSIGTPEDFPRPILNRPASSFAPSAYSLAIHDEEDEELRNNIDKKIQQCNSITPIKGEGLHSSAPPRFNVEIETRDGSGHQTRRTLGVPMV